MAFDILAHLLVRRLICKVANTTVVDRPAVGVVVYDAHGDGLSDITQYNGPRRTLVIEEGLFSLKALFVPLRTPRDIDVGMCTVDLALPRDTVVSEHALLPGDAQ